jgi:hypothetical protein
MVVFGLYFDLVCGLPPGVRDLQLCCVNSVDHVVFRHSRENATRMLLDVLRGKQELLPTWTGNDRGARQYSVNATRRKEWQKEESLVWYWLR